MMKEILVTGSSGLIGSEVVTYFDAKHWQVAGVDSNMRRIFFGEQGDTRWNQRRLVATCQHFTHYELDIRERERISGRWRRRGARSTAASTRSGTTTSSTEKPQPALLPRQHRQSYSRALTPHSDAVRGRPRRLRPDTLRQVPLVPDVTR